MCWNIPSTSVLFHSHCLFEMEQKVYTTDTKRTFRCLGVQIQPLTVAGAGKSLHRSSNCETWRWTMVESGSSNLFHTYRNTFSKRWTWQTNVGLFFRVRPQWTAIRWWAAFELDYQSQDLRATAGAKDLWVASARLWANNQMSGDGTDVNESHTPDGTVTPNLQHCIIKASMFAWRWDVCGRYDG